MKNYYVYALNGAFQPREAELSPGSSAKLHSARWLTDGEEEAEEEEDSFVFFLNEAGRHFTLLSTG